MLMMEPNRNTGNFLPHSHAFTVPSADGSRTNIAARRHREPEESDDRQESTFSTFSTQSSCIDNSAVPSPDIPDSALYGKPNDNVLLHGPRPDEALENKCHQAPDRKFGNTETAVTNQTGKATPSTCPGHGALSNGNGSGHLNLSVGNNCGDADGNRASSNKLFSNPKSCSSYNSDNEACVPIRIVPDSPGYSGSKCKVFSDYNTCSDNNKKTDPSCIQQRSATRCIQSDPACRPTGQIIQNGPACEIAADSRQLATPQSWDANNAALQSQDWSLDSGPYLRGPLPQTAGCSPYNNVPGAFHQSVPQTAQMPQAFATLNGAIPTHPATAAMVADMQPQPHFLNITTPATRPKPLPQLEKYAEFHAYPLKILTTSARNCLSRSLDGETLAMSSEGYLKDWRGLAELLGKDFFHMQQLERSVHLSPTDRLLRDWVTEEGATIGRLLEYLTKLGRFDILNDEELLICIKRSVAHYENSLAKAEAVVEPVVDSQVPTEEQDKQEEEDENKYHSYTVHDVMHGKEQHYHAFVCYEEANAAFVEELVEELEFNYGLKLCLNARDLLGGQDVYEVTAELIKSRCNRTVVVLSKSFTSASSEMGRFVVGISMSLSRSNSMSRIVPVICEPCEKPTTLSYITHIDFSRATNRAMNWKRLAYSLKDSARKVKMAREELEKLRAVSLRTPVDRTDLRASARAKAATRKAAAATTTTTTGDGNGTTVPSTLPDEHLRTIRTTCASDAATVVTSGLSGYVRSSSVSSSASSGQGSPDSASSKTKSKEKENFKLWPAGGKGLESVDNRNKCSSNESLTSSDSSSVNTRTSSKDKKIKKTKFAHFWKLKN